MKKVLFRLFQILPVLSAMLFSGCVSFRSEMDGSFNGAPSGDSVREPVKVFFHFSHLEFERGFDVVPKIIPSRRGFRDIFGESMKEITNIKSFATFTDRDNDIEDVPRRRQRDSLKAVSDYTVHLTFRQENSFAKHFLANIVSYGSATVLLVGFSWEYVITADVSNAAGKQIKSYTRKFSLTTWREMLFLFVYPFYPSEVKIEEIYLQSMQDIFRQIETEKVLTIEKNTQ